MWQRKREEEGEGEGEGERKGKGELGWLLRIGCGMHKTTWSTPCWQRQASS